MATTSALTSSLNAAASDASQKNAHYRKQKVMSLLAELEKVTPAECEHPLMQSILNQMSSEDREEMEAIRSMRSVSNWKLAQVLKARGHQISEGAVANWRRGMR